MAAIVSMVIALFASCSTDKKEPVDVHVRVMTIRISRTELTRAFADPIPDGAVPQIDNAVVSINGGALRETLDDAAIQRALTPAGYRVPVTGSVTEVTLTANGSRSTNVTQCQGSTVPLIATATGTDIVATVNPKDSEKVTYSVNLSPKPLMARLEVFGKIEALNPAWDRFEIEEVYVNNYLLSQTRARRYYTPGNGVNDFARSPRIRKEMYDIVPRDIDSQTAFQNGTKVIAYHLYPLTEEERTAATPSLYFDHLILKIKAFPADPSQTAREGYLTIRGFYENTKGDLKGFEAGKIYKFDLGTLSDMFNVANANDLPITPAPESGSPHSMALRTNSIPWTPNNATSRLNEYK